MKRVGSQEIGLGCGVPLDGVGPSLEPPNERDELRRLVEIPSHGRLVSDLTPSAQPSRTGSGARASDSAEGSASPGARSIENRSRRISPPFRPR